jgi:3-isopropylmalate/(R)-2-methylmalate dehydratase small subunit
MRAIAAPVEIANIDTDMLVPARFLKTVSKRGLANALFAAQRFDATGTELPGFILNRHPWNDAQILVALDNFGCGSSREHAPWALLDFGIRCVIAPSFADIFYGNCLKNGILPVRLSEKDVRLIIAMVARSETATLDVDLVEQRVITADGRAIRFELPEEARDRLLSGTDDIAMTLRRAAEIDVFEREAAVTLPWVEPIPPAAVIAEA